jgi:hypothetical protein
LSNAPVALNKGSEQAEKTSVVTETLLLVTLKRISRLRCRSIE